MPRTPATASPSAPRALGLMLLGWVALAGCVTLEAASPSGPPTATDHDRLTGVAALTADPTGVAPTPTRRPRVTARPTLTPLPEPTDQVVDSRVPTVTPDPTPTPRPTPRLRPRPRKGPFRVDLYRQGDFVSEFTAWYCLPAALQTMVNIMEPGRPDRTRRTQDRLYRLARRYSTDRLEGKGAEPIGWARALEHLGYGDWEVKAYRTRGQAIKAAAKALRMTGRPVGMLTWRGAHSWVMSGFRASADPALTDRYRVTSIVIQDVWYPRVSSIWGSSDPPGTWMRVEDLGRDFLRYNRWTVKYPGLDGRYVVVLPVPDDPAA